MKANSTEDDCKPENYQIRQANLHDLKALIALEKACFSTDDVWTFLDLIAALNFPGMLRLKAVRAGRMLGFIGAEIKEGIGWITTLEVEPASRHQGIGACLLQKAEEALKVNRVRLCARVSNREAIQLYEKHGYKPVGVWPEYYIGGEDALVMEKSLRTSSKDTE